MEGETRKCDSLESFERLFRRAMAGHPDQSGGGAAPMLQVVCVPINHHKGQSNRISAAPPGTDPEIHTLRPHFFVAKYFCLENGSPWDFLLSQAHPQRLHNPRLTPKLVSRLCRFSSVPDFPPVLLLLLPSTCSEAAGAVSSVDASQMTDRRWAR